MSETTKLERELLESMAGIRTHHEDGSEIRWGDWMGACLEGLQGMGLVTEGMRPQITDAGHVLLKGKQSHA